MAPTIDVATVRASPNVVPTTSDENDASAVAIDDATASGNKCIATLRRLQAQVGLVSSASKTDSMSYSELCELAALAQNAMEVRTTHTRCCYVTPKNIYFYYLLCSISRVSDCVPAGTPVLHLPCMLYRRITEPADYCPCHNRFGASFEHISAPSVNACAIFRVQ